MKCIQCIVSGRVQGVFFRRATQRKAIELDLAGWARNLPDGSVEVFACGEETAVQVLQGWLWEGPPHARVAEVKCAAAPVPERLDGFDVR